MSLETGFTLAVWGGSLGTTLLGTAFAHKHFSRTPPHLDAPFALYPVSILKPLKGAEEGLEENLESFFRLSYPDYELLFSVADARDPACAVVRRLMARYPGTPARLIVARVDVGPNPKVNNLIHSYAAARHDWLLISDSNIRVAPDYLRRMVAHLEADVGLVTAAVVGCAPRGLGGHLEAVILNTFYARGMILADRAGQACVLGKSMLFRRSVANRFGGIKALARYLAEDYMAGEAMKLLGLRIVTLCDPVRQHIGRATVRSFWQRHLRWGRIRKTQAPATFLAEPWFGCMVSAALGARGFHHAFGIPPVLFLVAHLSVWAACDLWVMRKLGAGLGYQVPVAWFLRELLALPLWIAIAAGNTVLWRGQRLRLGAGGILEQPR